MARVNTKEVMLSVGESVNIQRDNQLLTIVGPNKYRSMEDQDQAVVWSKEKGKLIKSPLDRAVQQDTVVPSGYYAVIHNPAYEESGALAQPKAGQNNTVPRLHVGTTTVVRGPAAITLWPGQDISVFAGHRLREDEYVVLVVTQEPGADLRALAGGNEINLGDRVIVRGPQFFIPPTGVELELDVKGVVRKAVRLDIGEYCTLIHGDGTKEVIPYQENLGLLFPDATQHFEWVTETNSVVGNGIDLRHNSVQAVDLASGEEMFFTDKNGLFYFPDPAHTDVKKIPVTTLGIGEVKYLVAKDGTATTVIGPKTLRVNPWTHDLCAHPQRQSTISIGDNEALFFTNASDQIQVMCGRKTVTLEFYERALRQLPLTQHFATTFKGVTKDNASISFEVNCQVDLDVDNLTQWATGEPKVLVNQFIRDQLSPLSQSFSVIDMIDNLEGKVLAALTQDEREVSLDGLTLSRFSVENFECTDAIVKTLFEERHAITLDAVKVEAKEKKAELIERQVDLDVRINEAHRSQELERLDSENKLAVHKHTMELDGHARAQKLALAAEDTKLQVKLRVEETNKDIEAARDETAAQIRARRLADHEVDLKIKTENQQLDLVRFTSEATAQKEILGIVTPQLAAAIELQGKSKLATEAIKHLGAQATARDKSVAEIVDQYTLGTVLHGINAPKVEKVNGRTS